MNGKKEESVAIELTQSQYTVGWVCALTEELAAATAMLDYIHARPSDLNLPSTDENVYFFGSVGKHNVVVTGLPKGKIGTVSAAVTARTLVGSFPSIKFGFMIGIGGGVPSEDHDIRLGDVVVSSPVRDFPGVAQWDLGKATDGGIFERTGALNSPPRALLAALTHLESTHEREDSSIPGYLEDLKAKAQKLMRSYGKPDVLSDILFSSDSPHRNDGSGRIKPGCEACDAAKIIQREDRDEPVKIHYGLIASGNQVIKDANLRDQLNAKFDGQVLCVEMEAAGLMESFPCIVIRGICDYADSHKNKKWQKYAALVAAAYAKELLMVVPYSAVEQMATIQSVCFGISERLDRISQHIENSQQGSQHKAILDWLTPVSYDSQQHFIFNRRQQGTCQWFLQSKEFRQFLQKDSRIMFCEGFPGVGKTILASIVVNYLQHDLGSCPEEKVGLAFVFGDFSQRTHQRPVDILASLTKQLLRDQAYVPQEITETYNKLREISAPSRSNNDNPTFSEMLKQVINFLSTRVFIVIDALDELDEAPSVLREVFNALEGTSASLFVTSRPNEKIQRMIKCDFEENSPFKIRAQAEDIELYMDERLSHLKLFSHEATEYSQETKSQLKIEIKRKVNEVVDGIFLLAKFHIDALEAQTTPRKIREKLETLYQGPDAYAQAYAKTIDRINSQRPELRLLAKRTLQWLTCSERVLSKLELRHALSFNNGDTSLPDQDSLEGTHIILDVCMGLVIAEGHERSLRLIHYTALEFLRLNLACLDRGQQHPTAYDAEAGAQRYMTEICFAYLSLAISDTRLISDCEHLELEKVRVLQADPRRIEAEWRRQEERPFDHSSESLWYKWESNCRRRRTEIESRHPFLRYVLEHCGHHAFKVSGDEETMTNSETAVSRLLESSAKVIAASLLASVYGGINSFKRGMTGLHFAARFGLKSALKALIESTQSEDPRDGHGKTPLFYAVEGGFRETAELLLENNASPVVADDLGWTPLSRIAMNGNEAMARLILKFSKGKECLIEKQKALLIAAGEGNEAVFAMLVDNGADPSYKSWEDSDPNMIRDATVIPGRCDIDRTVLSLVAENGCESIFNILLDSGVDVDLRDKDGKTPLLFAVQNGHGTIAKELLRRGANPNARDDKCRTPVFFAVYKGCEEMLELLLHHGADHTYPDPGQRETIFDYEGYLHCAVRKGYLHMASVLLGAGADPNSLGVRRSDQHTPLYIAAELGNEDFVRLLLADGRISVNRTHPRICRTPYWAALVRGHRGVVQILKQHGGMLQWDAISVSINDGCMS